MFKQALLTTLIFSISVAALAQPAKCYRYKDIIFNEVSIKKDLNYNPNPPVDEKKAYLFDLYQPKEDKVANRPLIIWMHGGGFKFGSKADKGMQIWGKTFAQRGYVCAAINYRLSKKNVLLHFDELRKGSYYAVQDAKMAVLYFRKHAREYGIDPDKIILGGNSAGGMIALQAAYVNNAELAKACGLPYTAGGAQQKKIFKVAGVINYWGGIYDIEWMRNAKVPIASVLGSKDDIVKPGNSDNALYGGAAIHAQADSLQIPNRLKILKGYGHELQKFFDPIFAAGKPTQKRWLEAGQFAADFFYDTLFK